MNLNQTNDPGFPADKNASTTTYLPYQTPTLMMFGDVRALTQGSFTMGTDSGGNMTSMMNAT